MAKALILNLGNPSNGETYAQQMKDLGYAPLLLQNECPKNKRVACEQIPLSGQATEQLGNAYTDFIYLPAQADVDPTALASAANGLVQYMASEKSKNPGRPLYIWSAAPFKVNSVFTLPNIFVRDAAPQIDAYGLHMLYAEQSMASAGLWRRNDCTAIARNFADSGFPDEALMLADGCFDKESTLDDIRLIQVAQQAGDAELAEQMLANIDSGKLNMLGKVHFAGAYQVSGNTERAEDLLDEVLAVREMKEMDSISETVAALAQHGFTTQLEAYLQNLAGQVVTPSSHDIAFDVAMLALKAHQGVIAFNILDELADLFAEHPEWQACFVRPGAHEVMRNISLADLQGNEALARRVLLKYGKLVIEQNERDTGSDISFFAEPMIALGFQDELAEFIGAAMDRVEDFDYEGARAYLTGYCYALLLKGGLVDRAQQLLKDAPVEVYQEDVDHERRSLFADFVRGATLKNSYWPCAEVAEELVKKDFDLDLTHTQNCTKTAGHVAADLHGAQHELVERLTGECINGPAQ